MLVWIGLKPILPLSRKHYVSREHAVGDRVGEDAVPQVAGADHPPVVEDAGDEADVPEWAVFGGEKGCRHPEGERREGAQREALEVVGIDNPAHEPAAPEELFEDGDGNYADEDAKGEEDGVRLVGWWGVAGG